MRSPGRFAQAVREFASGDARSRVHRLHPLDGMSRVLIRCVSRSGLARQITEQVAEHMRWCGHDVDVERTRGDYDIVVLVDNLAHCDIAKLECSPAYGPM
jgi:hypothetical protein